MCSCEFSFILSFFSLLPLLQVYRAGKEAILLTRDAYRPMGYVGGMVTKLNQPAGEIVKEMAEQAYQLLRGANRFLGGGVKL